MNPKEDFGVIFTKEETEDEAQYESEIIDGTTVFTIQSGKPFPTWLYKNIKAEFVQQVPDLINRFKLYIANSTLEDYSNDTADLRYFDLKLPVKEDILESRKVEYVKVLGSAPTHIAHSRHCH